jgi:hypothetical protein
MRITYITYDGKKASLYHLDDGFVAVVESMTPEERKRFKNFIDGKKQ